MTLETVYFPVAVTIAFAHSGIRRISARSLHSFKVEKFGSSTVNLTAPDGAIAYGVWNDTFERLPAGYVWVKFKNGALLAWAKRSFNGFWAWQSDTIRFEPYKFYAIKIQPTDYDPNGLNDNCNIVTKDGKICPYVSRQQFKVLSETSENCAPAFPRVLEAFPAPVPGVQRSYEPGVWDAPTEYNSIPVRYDDHLFSRFKHPTVKPVAALRLDLDSDRNPVYMCSYFGPAPK